MSIFHPRHREGTPEDLEDIERSGEISEVWWSRKLHDVVSKCQEKGEGRRT
jgi:hypothetical protein